MKCKCCITLAILIIIFAWIDATWSNWAVIIAALLILLCSWCSPCCGKKKTCIPPAPKSRPAAKKKTTRKTKRKPKRR